MKIRLALAASLVPAILLLAFAATAADAVPPADAGGAGVTTAPEAPVLNEEPIPSGPPHQPHWGIGARLGTTAASNWALDAWLDKHPSVDGSSTGLEIRYYGEKGSSAFSSLAITADFLTLTGTGEWRETSDSDLLTGGADLEMQAYTLTAYYDIFPSWPVHPYFGIGIGYAKLSGDVTLTSSSEIKTWKPKELVAVHVPVGLGVNIGKFVTVRGEARFLDSLSYGGMLMVNF